MESSHLAMFGGDRESSEYGVRWFSVTENSTTNNQVYQLKALLDLFWMALYIRMSSGVYARECIDVTAFITIIINIFT